MKTFIQKIAPIAFVLTLATSALWAHDNEKSTVRFPNTKVADGILQVETAEACQIKIVDALGQVIYRQNFKAGENKIQLPDLSKGGTHILKMMDASGRVIKMVKLTYKQID